MQHAAGARSPTRPDPAPDAEDGQVHHEAGGAHQRQQGGGDRCILQRVENLSGGHRDVKKRLHTEKL